QIETFLQQPAKGSQSLSRAGGSERCPAQSSGVPARAVLELVQSDLAAERVTVDAQHACGARLVALRAVEHPLDELLFEFGHRLVEEDASLHHLSNQRFQLILHDCTLLPDKRGFPDGSRQVSSWPVNCR